LCDLLLYQLYFVHTVLFSSVLEIYSYMIAPSPSSCFTNSLSYILMNGSRTTNATIPQMTATIAAIICPPVLSKAPTPIGEGQGIRAIIGFTILNLIAQ